MLKSTVFINVLLTMFILLIGGSYGKKLNINGVDNSEIVSLIKDNIESSRRQKDVTEDSISMHFVMEEDISIVKSILSSYGYFDAEVKIDQKNQLIVLDIKLNDRYKFNDVSLVYKDYPEYSSGVTIEEVFDLIGIERNGYTTTRDISDGCSKLKNFYQKHGFAFVEVCTPSIKVNKENKTFKVVFNIKLNKQIILDDTTVVIKTGNQKHQLLQSFVRNRVEWKDGDMYSEDKVEKTKDKLMATGIFSSVDVKIDKPEQDDNKKHIGHSKATVTVEEAKLRDISVGASFGTTEKLGGSFSWSHYNVDGKGSKFSSITSITKKLQAQRLKYSMPDLFGKRQELKNHVFVLRENVAAYTVKKFGTESILWQEIVSDINVGAGISSEISKTKDKIKDSEEEKPYQKFKTVGVPFGVTVDTTDVFLDPQRGFRCVAMTTPYICKQHFTSFSGKCSFYVPFLGSKYRNNVVLACYSKLGSMLTSKRRSVPRDKLFFGGGVSSVRGYGYQLLGDVNDDKKPLGGESLFEIGVEPRFKINDNLGLVTFVEGGNVYNARIPKFSRKLMWGGGFGVRYYTPLGPIRLDIAFPFKRRKTSQKKSIDSAFNIYISVGQAF